MNYKKLKILLEMKGAKSRISRITGISRPAIDSILAGGDLKVSNLEKIADALHVKVGYFFDEELGDADMLDVPSRMQLTADETITQLKEQIQILKAQIEDKNLIINLLREK